MLATSALYGKMSPLQLPFASIVEEYKAGKVRTVMTLRYSKDMKIRENPPEVRTGRKWNAESRVDDVLSQLEHSDIIGSVQTNREGLGMKGFKPFSAKDRREKRMAVVNEIRRTENEKRYVNLVQNSVQGQCLQWEAFVMERKISWKEIWAWEAARTSFLIKSTYDVLPSPVNLNRWKQSQNANCKCGERGTMKHILSHCPMGLNRRTWWHNQVLKVIGKNLKAKLNEINEGKRPKIEEQEEISFVKEGVEVPAKNKVLKKIDDKWLGNWKIDVDLNTLMVFPLIPTSQRPDIVVWSEERRMAIVMELTVSWEDNIKRAEIRKDVRYRDLIENAGENWDVEYYHIGIGARGFIERSFFQLLTNRFRFSKNEGRKTIKEIQEAVEKASFWLWLKRDDPNWNESQSK